MASNDIIHSVYLYIHGIYYNTKLDYIYFTNSMLYQISLSLIYSLVSYFMHINEGEDCGINYEGQLDSNWTPSCDLVT